MKTRANENGSCKAVPEFLLDPYGSQIPLRFTAPNGRHHSEREIGAATPSETVEVVTAQLDGGGSAELIEDPEDATRTLFAVSQNDQVRFTDRIEARGRVLAPLKRHSDKLFAIKLPRGVRAYQSPAWLAREAGKLVDSIVSISEEMQLILGAFVMHTWISDQFSFSPCPVILGPVELSLPLVQALSLVCRRALVVGKATPAGMLEVCSRIGSTLLLLDYGLSLDVRRLVRMGMRRDVVAIQKNGALSPFGPKLIASLELPADPYWLSDGFLLALDLSNCPNLMKVCDRQVAERADELQQCLLQFRFDCLKAGHALGDKLRSPSPRTVSDKFRCLVLPFVEDERFCAKLIRAAQWSCRTRPLPVRQRAVVAAQFFLAHEHRQSMLVGKITDVANQVLEEWGEEITLPPRKVGSILDGLGFVDRERTDEGYELLLDAYTLERVHQLATRYGVFEVELYSSQEPRATCECCRRFKLVSKAEIRRYENEYKPQIEQNKREAEAQLRKRIEDLRSHPPSWLKDLDAVCDRNRLPKSGGTGERTDGRPRSKPRRVHKCG